MRRLATAILVIAAFGCVSNAEASRYDELGLHLAQLITREQRNEIAGNYAKHFGRFEQNDRNGDGGIDRDEWAFALSSFPFAFDLNKDGSLSWPEFAVASCPLPLSLKGRKDVAWEYCVTSADGLFVKLDKSRDAQLTLAEHYPEAISKFGFADFCADGRVTAIEFSGVARDAAARGENPCKRGV